MLEKINEFYKKKIPTTHKKVVINVISDVTFEPLNKFLPFYIDKFEINPILNIGNFDQLEFDLANLNEENCKNFQFLYIHSSSLKYFALASGIKNSDFSFEFNKLLNRYLAVIEQAIKKNPNIQFILNLFELPPYRLRGTNSVKSGVIKSINDLNSKILELSKNYNIVIQDSNYLSASLGLNNWYDFNSWAAFKQPFTGEALKSLGKSLASIIAAAIGKSKKLLICDLDNTLWGGIIGDDGPEKIHLGHSTAKGELYLFVQSYVKSLQMSGIVVGISSKNEFDNAKLGFSTEASILDFDDFANKKINWLPKSENINNMLKELNLGPESVVFLDDNLVEINEVLTSIPKSQCINFKKTPIEFLKKIDELGLFETQKITNDDLIRNKAYLANTKREIEQKSFKSYIEFLVNLNMKSNFFWNVTNDKVRISNLINKTNQFNTSQIPLSITDLDRYISEQKKFILSADLTDKFGYNGVITVIFGKIILDVLLIENWVMSCRVFNRTMEMTVIKMLALKAIELRVKKIEIIFKASPKNNYCQKFFENSKFLKKNQGSKYNYELIPSEILKKIEVNNESKISFKVY